MIKEKSYLNIVIAGGGTGGHLFPGVAIAEEFKNISDKHRILFLNTGNKIERQILDKANFNYKVIPSAGFFNKNIKDKLKSILKIISSVSKASSILNEFRADAVIGVGGYVSVPILIAAILNNIPVFIQEQNTIPGMANRLFSWFAVMNFTGFKNTKKGFKKRVTYTGNPIRKRINLIEYSIKSENTILVTGGSQGAHRINQAFMNCINDLKDKKNILFIHQTGEKDFEKIKQIYEQKKLKYMAAPFFNNMDKLYGKTSLIISRAGASTLAEISCANIPAILIPFPYATHNHQFHNAKALTKEGAAIIIEENENTACKFAEQINFLLSDKKKLLYMSEKMKNTAKPDAAKNICELIIRKTIKNVR